MFLWMRSTIPAWLAFVAVVAIQVLSATPRALGHGDVHEAIAALTAQIEAAPGSGDLYFERAILHRAHQDWDGALRDLEKAEQLKPGLKLSIVLARAETLMDANRVAEARLLLDDSASGTSPPAKIFALRARCLLLQGESGGAIADFQRAINSSPRPDPLLYLACAKAQIAAGKQAEAIATMDEAIQVHGPIVTLVQPAIEMDEATGRFDEAVQRIDALIPKLPRRELWLVRKAHLLERAGRVAEARAAYAEAKARLETLPVERRQTESMLALARRIDSGLAVDFVPQRSGAR